MARLAKILIWTITIFFFSMALLIIITGTLALKSNKPLTLFNYTFSVVPTDSMEPDIKVGDFVIGKVVSFDTLKKDDDVIFYSEKNEKYIVHRIYSDLTSEGFLTKGINNTSIDEGYLTSENFISIVVASGGILGLGKITTNYRNLIMFFLILMFFVILLKEAVKIYKAIYEYKHEENKENSETNITDSEKEKMREEVLKELEEEGLITNKSK